MPPERNPEAGEVKEGVVNGEQIFRVGHGRTADNDAIGLRNGRRGGA
jgi:hypothetical protein